MHDLILPRFRGSTTQQTFMEPLQSSSATGRQRSFFLLAELLSVRCAPVSERAKACKEAKGISKQTTENRQANTQTKPKKHNQNKPKNTRNTTPKQNPLQRVKQVKRVRRNPHRTGENRV